MTASTVRHQPVNRSEAFAGAMCEAHHYLLKALQHVEDDGDSAIIRRVLLPLVHPLTVPTK